MNRKAFALSWGRKIFFGIAWPLFCLIALSYFQGQIIPRSALSIFYYAITLIGHFGLITSALYFVLYYPVISIFPNYYFTRFWTLFLIMGTAVFLLIDSFIFSLYRMHVNIFFTNLFLEGKGKEIISLQPSVYIICACLFLACLIYIWYQGEKTWRSMQKRFSNVNKNWYLVLILVLVVVSHMMHIFAEAYGNRKISRFAQNFPLYYGATAKNVLGQMNLLPATIEVQEDVVRDLQYPVGTMNCTAQAGLPNIIFITVNDLVSQDITSDATPKIIHFAQHGSDFRNHHSNSENVRGGIFSMFYGLPETYWQSMYSDQVSPVLIDELVKRNYDFGVFTDFSLQKLDLNRTVFLKVPKLNESANVVADWKIWLDAHLQKTEPVPFFSYLGINSLDQLDEKVNDVVNVLFSKGLLKNTVILFSGVKAQKLPDSKIPFFYIRPGLKGREIAHLTSQLDLAPTLLTELLDCRNEIATYSDGQSLFTTQANDWLQVGSDSGYKIVDFLKQNIITVKSATGYKVTNFTGTELGRSKAREELIIRILKSRNRFRKQAKL